MTPANPVDRRAQIAAALRTRIAALEADYADKLAELDYCDARTDELLDELLDLRCRIRRLAGLRPNEGNIGRAA